MPDAHSPADPPGIGPQPFLEIVEQRFERADVEHGDTAPVLVSHAGEYREGGGLGLASGGGCEEKSILAGHQGFDGRVLERAQPGPAQGGDDVMLQGGVEVVETGHGEILFL